MILRPHHRNGLSSRRDAYDKQFHENLKFVPLTCHKRHMHFILHRLIAMTASYDANTYERYSYFGLL